MPRPQGPGQQRGQRRGDPGLGQRERCAEAALGAEQVERPQPVPQRVELGADGAGQPGAVQPGAVQPSAVQSAARLAGPGPVGARAAPGPAGARAAAGGPALHAVHVGQQPGQLVVSGRPAGQDDHQGGFAHRDREVGLRAVVRADQRRGADMPAGGGVGGHEPARLGEHQARAPAPDGSHLALRHAAQRVQREDVEFLAEGADELIPPAELLDRLAHQGGRDVVPGGEAQAFVGAAEQPAQRGQRVVRDRGRLEQARDEAAGQP